MPTQTLTPPASKQHIQKEFRLHSLDYLRGLAAFGIMAYHFMMWTMGEMDSSRKMGRVGIYGVSIFYVLSGLTLFLVYHKMKDARDLKNFYIRRIFRIFPLLWIATILTIIVLKVSTSFKIVFLNLTGLFGFVSWDSEIARGVWSIGNELVFYAMFPLLIWSWRRKVLFLPFILLFGLYVYFAFFKLDSNVSLGLQWADYVNPLNQAFLFFAGFMIGVIGKKASPLLNVVLFLVAVSAFILIPSRGDKITIVTGWERLAYSAICIMLCYSFYSLKQRALFFHRPLSMLGEASYSVYLLHPIVFALVPISNPTVKLVVCIPLTLFAAWCVYRFFEKLFTAKAKRITAGRKSVEVKLG